MGAILVALSAGALVLDQQLPRWYPCLLVLVLVLALAASYELLQLLPIARRPSAWLCYSAVTAMILANWLSALCPQLDTWRSIASVFVGILLLVFIVEMAFFRFPGDTLARISLTTFTVAYLGLLPSFLVQLRWPSVPEEAGSKRATAALALAIFVPKCGDIGAYFTGRFLGCHKMAPILSPKKTWEGAIGGMAAAALAAIGIDRFTPVVRGGLIAAAGCGAALGVAGILGDLAESLIKRDCEHKDASQVLPGFGGVLDVVDSVLFAAPVAYWLLK
jgi:phosphatidate cytidylyltransferase